MMIYILLVYLPCLVYLSANKVTKVSFDSIKKAWFWFAMIPMCYAVFTVFEAGNIRSPRDLALVAIWQEGFTWLFLSVSFLRLSGMMGSSVAFIANKQQED